MTGQPIELGADVQEALKKMREFTAEMGKFSQEASRRHSLGLLSQKEREDITELIDESVDMLVHVATRVGTN